MKSDGVHGKQDADKQTEKRTSTFASYERILRQSKTDTKKKKKVGDDDDDEDNNKNHSFEKIC